MTGNQEKKGILSFTKAWHDSIGSSVYNFEQFIEGPIKPNVPFGKQMTDDALRKWYNMELDGVRTYLGLSPAQRKVITDIMLRFRLDFPYLISRGIDVTEGERLMKEVEAAK